MADLFATIGERPRKRLVPVNSMGSGAWKPAWVSLLS